LINEEQSIKLWNRIYRDLRRAPEAFNPSRRSFIEDRCLNGSMGYCAFAGASKRINVNQLSKIGSECGGKGL